LKPVITYWRGDEDILRPSIIQGVRNTSKVGVVMSRQPHYYNNSLKQEIWAGAGPTVKCPLCNKDVSSAPTGTQSHMRGHIKRKDVTSDEARAIARQMSPQLDTELTARGIKS